jgi:hypothetical protein
VKLVNISDVTNKTIKKQKQFWKMQYDVCKKRTANDYTEKNIDNEFVAFENWQILENFRKGGSIR